MPDIQVTSQDDEMRSMHPIGVIDISLPAVRAIGLSELQSEELTDVEMAEQVRRLLAYVLQAPGGKHDPEIWMKGFNYKKLAAFAKEEMGRTGKVPFTVLYVLDHLWKNIAKSRERIGHALGIAKDTDTGEYPASFPEEPHIDDNSWLKNYKKMLMSETEGLAEESVNSMIVDRGRETVIKVVLAVFRKNRPLRDDEREAIGNMAQTVTSAEVMNAILPFAEEDPWIGIHLLKNFALVDPKKRIAGLAEQVDFTNVINNLTAASREDMDIATELAGVLSNPHESGIIKQISFDDVIKRAIEFPTKNQNLTIALLKIGSFSMRDIYLKIMQEAKKAYDSMGNIGEYAEIVQHVPVYLRDKLKKMRSHGAKHKDDDLDDLNGAIWINRRLKEIGISEYAEENAAAIEALKTRLTRPLNPVDVVIEEAIESAEERLGRSLNNNETEKIIAEVNARMSPKEPPHTPDGSNGSSNGNGKPRRNGVQQGRLGRMHAKKAASHARRADKPGASKKGQVRKKKK